MIMGMHARVCIVAAHLANERGLGRRNHSSPARGQRGSAALLRTRHGRGMIAPSVHGASNLERIPVMSLFHVDATVAASVGRPMSAAIASKSGASEATRACQASWRSACAASRGRE